MLELRLADAERDMIDNALIIKELRERIAARERLGGDCAEERESLDFFMQVEAAHVAHCETLRRQLDEIRLRPRRR